MAQRFSFWDRFETQPLARAVFIGLIALVLLIPINMIGDMTQQRRMTAMQAAQDITSRWGNAQTIIGPVLKIPWTCHWQSADRDGKITDHHYNNTLYTLPQQLKIQAAIDNSSRHRGIFEVGIYETDIAITGNFNPPQIPDCQQGRRQVDWDAASLAIQISDTHALRGRPSLEWQGETLNFTPGSERFSPEGNPAIEVILAGHLAETDSATELTFNIPLAMNGSSRLLIAPTGEETQARFSSNWPHPSFFGQWLPTSHDITEQGFKAQWKVPYLGRGYPQQWVGDSMAQGREISTALFGVDFLVPIDAYTVAERSVKYALLFIASTFLCLWLFEILAGLRVHGIQYLLFGAALCLFYLLELSLTEHLGVPLAYLISSAAMVSVVSAYALAVLRSRSRAAAMGLLISLLYGYLYILLQLESYALLTGAVGLLIGLITIMWLTRNIDWYALTGQMQKRSQITEGEA